MPSKTTFHLLENALTTDNVHEPFSPLGRVAEPTLSSLSASLHCLVSTLSAYLQLQKVLTFAIADSSLTVAERNRGAICILLINQWSHFHGLQGFPQIHIISLLIMKNSPLQDYFGISNLDLCFYFIKLY